MFDSCRPHARKFSWLLLLAGISFYLYYSIVLMYYYQDTSMVMFSYDVHDIEPLYVGSTHLHGRHVKDVWLKPAKPEQLSAQYKPHIKVVDVDLLLTIVRKFKSVMSKHKMNYFLSGNTLLGAYRHHGLIPWKQAVISVTVDTRDKQLLQEEISNISSSYVLDTHSENQWKFYSYYCETVPGTTYKYPFVEVTFYQEKDDKVIVQRGYPSSDDLIDGSVVNGVTNEQVTLNKNKVFPLTSLPLWNVALPVPKDSGAILEEFGMDANYCVKAEHDQLRTNSTSSILCTQLWDQYPFVTMTIDKTTGNEVSELWKHREYITTLSKLNYNRSDQ